MDLVFEYQLKEFKIKLLMSDGQVFENFFCDFMAIYKEDFRRVRAFGGQGDRKNDGFLPSSGEYYQCYAPEDISLKRTEAYALNKLIKDFDGLFESWDTKWPIKKFLYVLNDKYKGTPPSVWDEINHLGNRFKHVVVGILDSDGIERIFKNKFSKEQRRELVGITPPEVTAELKSFNTANQEYYNLKGWLTLLNSLISDKMECLEKLNIKNWYYKDNQQTLKNKYISDLKKLMSNQITIQLNFLEDLKDKYPSLFYIWEKYFNNEKEIINKLILNLNRSESEVFKNTNWDYQSFITESISSIINMYNEVVNLNNNVLDQTSLSKVNHNFGKIIKEIPVNNNNSNELLEGLLIEILQSKNLNSITIIQNSKVGFSINDEIRNTLNSIAPFMVFNGDLGMDDLISFLIGSYESITEDGRLLFSPHLNTNHIIFLDNSLNFIQKERVLKLQKRSNIGLYFFIKDNSN